MNRSEQLLDVGAALAAKHGAANVTRRMVAQEAKVSEALVSHHMGSAEDAQKKYARRARALGYKLPDKAQEAENGRVLRAHGPRDQRDTRVRSERERQAIVNKRKRA